MDSSLAVALLDGRHEHHPLARAWFADLHEHYATCPITQGAVVRYTMRRGRSPRGAVQALQSLTGSARHEFWSDDVDYGAVEFDGIIGHRQVTDAYLAQLARRHDGRIATFDKGLAALHTDVAELVPTS